MLSKLSILSLGLKASLIYFKGFPLKLTLNLWGYKNSFKLALIFFLAFFIWGKVLLF
ncbi:hypothetical protein HPNQ4216_1432 [Helicobacter pylori NQ4216]|nr:hypothetical protein HPNQ4216_1432 [Helicobacter pylori NQ4216]